MRNRQFKAEIYQGANGNWFFRIKSPNGKTVATGESNGYKRKGGARKSLNSLVIGLANNGLDIEYLETKKSIKGE